jgi:uncharacterized NAD(P)/FAD-binding protein YdhS
MNTRVKLALIGSGPSSIYLLKHLLDEAEVLKGRISGVSIFEKDSVAGLGMPYSPKTTDRFNLSNISSEELPELPETLYDWMKAQELSDLKSLGLPAGEISESEIYPRLILGRYLSEQYRAILVQLNERGIPVTEYPDCEIIDVQDDEAEETVRVITEKAETHTFDRVIISTGHFFKQDDEPAKGFYASPWPISKLLPKDGEYFNFAIGTLGASLSAFDVVTSLAHRHGRFVKEADRTIFLPHEGADEFKIVMHASKGLLPHLQFDQEEPMRDIYRHGDREQILGLVNGDGFMRIHAFFDEICRPALREAFEKDDLPEMVALMDDPESGWKEMVEKLTDEHDYSNAFEGMRLEMVEAERSVQQHEPIHWKEVIDDLIYMLNFHAELMPAEDHVFLQSVIMPFLMNVVAAMPLESGRILLALYDAGRLEMIAGDVTIEVEAGSKGTTQISVEDEDGEKSSISYRMFIDCSGQKPLSLKDYPFPSLVEGGAARKARSAFQDEKSGVESMSEDRKEHLFEEDGELLYHMGGIDIDGTYRLIGAGGKANPRIYDVAFPHTSGARPYSYGLQACNDTGGIVIQSWVNEIRTGKKTKSATKEVTKIYEEISE